MVEYLTEDQLIELNKEVLKEIRVKKGDIHKVLSREKITAVTIDCRQDPGDIYDKASTLLIGMVKAHSFDSANRRTAIAATILFLKANGEELKLKHDEKVLTGIREGFYTKSEVKDWLRGNAIRPFHR